MLMILSSFITEHTVGKQCTIGNGCNLAVKKKMASELGRGF